MKNLISLLLHFKFRILLIEDTDDTWIQFFRSLFVGGVATLVDMGVCAVCREVFMWGVVGSNVTGFSVGLIVNYLISTFWIFKNRNMNVAKEFIGFSVIGIIGLVINTLITAVLGHIWDVENARIMFYVAKIIATFITLIWNFTARKFILYRK